jgi:predicted DNA-binding transcriptional regulator AlpA
MAEMLSEQQAAEWLGLTRRTLQKWRHTGRGPRHVKYSARCVRYSVTELRAWTESRTFAHTAEADDANL